MLNRVIIARHRIPKHEPSAAQAKAGNYAKRKVSWRGLTISIENEAGSVRRGRKPDGTPWMTRMLHPYGYINRTEGVDGDHVDVFLGPDLDAPVVYVIHQRKVDDWANYDEDKCMVGFPSEEAARDAFLSNYDDPRFLGPITAMPVEEFAEKARATFEEPKMIKSAVVLVLKARVGSYVRGGRLVQGYDNHRQKQADHGAQGDLFDHAPAAAAAPESPNKERFESIHTDAEGRDPSGLKECSSCHYPHKGEHCENPGCEANPHSNKEALAKQKADAEQRRAEDAERARINEIRNRALAGNKPKPVMAFPKPGAVSPGEHAIKLTPRQADLLGVELEDYDGGDEGMMMLRQALRDGHLVLPRDPEKRNIIKRAINNLSNAADDSHRATGDQEREGDSVALMKLKDKVGAASPAPLADGHSRAHYVTVVRHGGTPSQKVGWLAGPFDSHDEAKGHVDRARAKANELDPDTAFDAFGTSSREAAKHPPGVLNSHLGIDAGGKGGQAAPMIGDAKTLQEHRRTLASIERALAGSPSKAERERLEVSKVRYTQAVTALEAKLGDKAPAPEDLSDVEAYDTRPGGSGKRYGANKNKDDWKAVGDAANRAS